MARETTDEVAIPNPSAMLTMNITTGKVNPIAANSSVPSRETKKVSTRLNTTIESMPNTIGMASEISFFVIGPCVRWFFGFMKVNYIIWKNRVHWLAFKDEFVKLIININNNI